ncbi:MAG TPA: GRP family sugar transporter [Armatimonadota bacterium]|nr:GRP family sugar transporter [Armatimonadota bacterium]
MNTILVLGFILGILSALFFAFYMVPQKIVKIDNTSFLWTMGLGVLVTSLIPYAIVGFPTASNWWQRGAGILCGVVWGLGTLAFAAGINRIGLALATPIKNTTGVLGTLVGFIFFHEWHTTNPWLGIGGSVLIVAAAIIIGLAGDKSSPRQHTLTGIACSLVAALCYASYLYPLKRVVQVVGYWEFTPWMAVGILLTATVAVLLRPGGFRAFIQYQPRVYGLALLGGVAWAIALFCLAASMVMVDLSVAWSLAQLNTIPAVFLGALLFREIDFHANKKVISLGLLAATFGTILLGLAK